MTAWIEISHHWLPGQPGKEEFLDWFVCLFPYTVYTVALEPVLAWSTHKGKVEPLWSWNTKVAQDTSIDHYLAYSPSHSEEPTVAKSK